MGDKEIRLIIDANALKEYMCSICDNRERCEDREQVCSLIADIDEQPTIEVEPVKHGRWKHSKAGGLPTNRFVCSECDGLVQVSTYRNRCMFNYCPNCGAKMDGGADNGS